MSPRKDRSSDSSALPTFDAAQVDSSGATGHVSRPVNETAVGDSDSESVTGRLVKDSEEGEISDTETQRSVRAFLGWFEYSPTLGKVCQGRYLCYQPCGSL